MRRRGNRSKKTQKNSSEITQGNRNAEIEQSSPAFISFFLRFLRSSVLFQLSFLKIGVFLFRRRPNSYNEVVEPTLSSSSSSSSQQIRFHEKKNFSHPMKLAAIPIFFSLLFFHLGFTRVFV